MSSGMIFRFCISLFLLAAAASNAEEPRYSGTMAYVTDGMQYLRERDVQTAFQVWIDEMAASGTIGARIVYYDRAEEAVDAFVRFRHALLAVNPYLYMQHRKAIAPVEKALWIVQKGPEHPYEMMVLLTRRDSGIMKVADLAGKRLMIRDDNYLGRMFLEREVLQTLHRPAAHLLAGFSETKKHSQAVLKTFFAQTEACVVPLYVFELMAEMNPALLEEIQIVAQSPRIFVPIMSVFHRQTPDDMIETYGAEVLKLEATVKGQNILDLFKMRRMIRVTPEDLEPMQRYYDEYRALAAEYGDE